MCIHAAVSYSPNHKRFDELEGIQLMLIFIRFVFNRNHFYILLEYLFFVRKGMYCMHSALKIIDYQLSNDPDMCSKFVELLGLKTIFAAFMKKV